LKDLRSAIGDLIEDRGIGDWGLENPAGVWRRRYGTRRALRRSVTPQELRARTTAFGSAAVRFCRDLRRLPEARNIADQTSASATAISANYRSASRARTRREFISKLAIAVEEAEETVGWLEIAIGSGCSTGAEVQELLREANELLAILAASRRTAQRNDPAGRDAPASNAKPRSRQSPNPPIARSPIDPQS
jgi:four helix bundle protein